MYRLTTCPSSRIPTRASASERRLILSFIDLIHDARFMRCKPSRAARTGAESQSGDDLRGRLAVALHVHVALASARTDRAGGARRGAARQPCTSPFLHLALPQLQPVTFEVVDVLCAQITPDHHHGPCSADTALLSSQRLAPRVSPGPDANRHPLSICVPQYRHTRHSSARNTPTT